MPVESRTAGTQTERGGDLLTEYDKVAAGAEANGALVIARAAEPPLQPGREGVSVPSRWPCAACTWKCAKRSMVLTLEFVWQG